ncbi:MAG: response regulator [Candidatus Auribacterota bacterium]|jgi:PleD family two-component response regulator|nr:response regulator [Candidatus Auribacterota bacterium]
MPTQQKRSVLVVDDFPAMRHSIRQLMETRGFGVVEACNGIEALDKLKNHSFDLIVSDLVMPEMDGFELCESIKNDRRTSSVPVIVVSTQTDVRFIMRALKAGADDYIIKPVQGELLDKVLQRAFLSEDIKL